MSFEIVLGLDQDQDPSLTIAFLESSMSFTHSVNQSVSNALKIHMVMDCMVKKFIGGHFNTKSLMEGGWRHRETSRKCLKVVKSYNF